MVAKVKASVRAQQAYLRRLAIVYANDLRIRIVSELSQRELSPKQFYEEFGGGSVSRVDQHFKKLAEHGWLRLVRSEGPDSRRRGGVEHFYRARELAIIDNETWALVPYSVRAAMSWRIFETLAERMREALEAETLDARPEGHLRYMTMNLDQLGWEKVLAAVDALFESIFEEQADSRLRIFHSGEKPMVATVALAAFESPARPPLVPSPRATPELVHALEESRAPFHHRVSRVFGDELSRRILAEANLREISAPLFHAEVGGDSIEAIRRCFKTLEKASWLLQVAERTGGRRRAGRELFYRATGPVMYDEKRWANMRQAVQPGSSWETFEPFADLVREAIDAGTLDARLDRHLSWSLLRLDQQGWESVAKGIDELLSFVLKEKDRAKVRLRRSSERPIPTTIGLGAFESPKSAIKAP